MNLVIRSASYGPGLDHARFQRLPAVQRKCSIFSEFADRGRIVMDFSSVHLCFAPAAKSDEEKLKSGVACSAVEAVAAVVAPRELSLK